MSFTYTTVPVHLLEKHEQFALAAMQGALASGAGKKSTMAEIAMDAVQMAEEMMLALGYAVDGEENE